MRKAVFLDKDGTLIPDIPYNVDPSRIILEGGALEGLKLLGDAGFALLLVSNQPGVAHGYFRERDLLAVGERIGDLLGAAGVRLEGFYYCPHHPEGSVPEYSRVCDCRKPKIGLLLKAERDYGLDLSRSWMVGDILNDVEAGNRAGCGTVLIDNGHETEWHWSAAR